MKTKLLITLTSILLALIPNVNFGQSINLGTAANFVLFTTNGAVSNTGFSHLTGHVGSNSSASTAFGNVDGVMHDQDGASAQCAADLLIAYNQLNAVIPNFFHAPLLGNGDTLIAGVYSIDGSTTLNLALKLDAEGDANAKFIFKIQGSFSTNAASKIILLNGAKACNVFWKIEGLTDMATGTSMKGTVIVNNAAIIMNTGSTLEGRALSTTGAVTVHGIQAYTPIGCGSPVLNGPTAPDLATTKKYTIFTANGDIANTGISTILGDVGTNMGTANGYNALSVTGTIHSIPDVSTAQCAADLINVYTYLNTLPHDIELLYPAQFGNSLVLTPHVYLLNASTVLTDTVFLDAQNNANAVFVMKIAGALSTSTYANVVLRNGAQAKNVFWVINGAASLNNYSNIAGIMVCNNGAFSVINTGVTLNGKAFTTSGAINTINITTTMPADDIITEIESTKLDKPSTATFAPNPFKSSTTLILNGNIEINPCTVSIYNIFGSEILTKNITKQQTSFELDHLAAGIYLYKVTSAGKIIQTGKLISN